MSAMIGQAVADGKIDVTRTLEDLGIDDNDPRLSTEEKQATIHDLLMARSGVYHIAQGEAPSMSAARPKRHSHLHGTFWYYNNWDFNALGTILERALGRSLFDEFAEAIAGPAGMEDFDLARQGYATQPFSEHRTYAFHISTRDLARFGQLYLNHGRHGDRDVIPAEWVTDSTRAHTPTGRGPDGRGPAYGYLWWVAHDGQLFAGTVVPDGSYAAYGMGSQFLLVVPALERVIALLADPTRPGGADAVPRRPKLAELVHHASAGAVPLQR
jgi:CubicO group peptidase (beta-lactamase class C family)